MNAQELAQKHKLLEVLLFKKEKEEDVICRIVSIVLV